MHFNCAIFRALKHLSRVGVRERARLMTKTVGRREIETSLWVGVHVCGSLDRVFSLPNMQDDESI